MPDFCSGALPEYPAASVRDYCSGALTEADVRTTVDTARLKGANPFDVIVGVLA